MVTVARLEELDKLNNEIKELTRQLGRINNVAMLDSDNENMDALIVRIHEILYDYKILEKENKRLRSLETRYNAIEEVIKYGNR